MPRGTKSDEDKKRRLCVTLRNGLLEQIERDYPFSELSPTIEALVEYAVAAGFLKRLSEINPNTPLPKLPAKPPAPPKVAKVAPPPVPPIPATTPEVEEFGV
jgi:hypothetical protein